jgi:hypothetical protein
MITKVLPLQFIKKTPLYGSYQKMRYCLRRQDDNLSVCIYPGPFGYDATPEEYKEYFTFEFSEEGYDAALALLNEKYEGSDWAKKELPFATTPLADGTAKEQ